MVAFLFPGAEKKLLHPRPVCHARRTLLIAQRALERGETITAGCQLRESLREYLVALCDYYDCRPGRRATTARLINALVKAGEFGDTVSGWLREILDAGNRAAHCKYVEPGMMEGFIAVMHFVLDHSPEIQSPGFSDREGGAV